MITVREILESNADNMHKEAAINEMIRREKTLETILSSDNYVWTLEEEKKIIAAFEAAIVKKLNG